MQSNANSNKQPRRKTPIFRPLIEKQQLLSPAEKRQVRNMIQSMVQEEIEDKVTYVTTDALGVSNTGQVVNLQTNLVRADVAVNGFTGNLIKPTNLRCRYVWSTDQTFSSVRLLVFQWKDASIPSLSGILQYAGVTLSPLSPLLWSNIHKIKVLYDKTHTLKLRNTTGFDAKYFEFNIPGDRMETIQFASGTTLVQMNGIFMIAVSDDSVVSYPSLGLIAELTYSDA